MTQMAGAGAGAAVRPQSNVAFDLNRDGLMMGSKGAHPRGGLAELLLDYLTVVARESAGADDDIFLVIANGLVDVCDAQMARVYLADTETRSLTLMAVAAAARKSVDPTIPIPFDRRREVLALEDQLLTTRAARTRTLQFAEGAAFHSLASSPPRTRGPNTIARACPAACTTLMMPTATTTTATGAAPPNAVFALPLLAQDTLVGVISTALPRSLTSDDCTALVSIAQVLGAMIERVRLSDEITFLQKQARERAEWTSLVAHELRQPLNSIIGRASSLSANDDSPPDGSSAWSSSSSSLSPSPSSSSPWASDPHRSRASAERILKNALHLNRLVTDLQDASAVDIAKLPLNRERTSLVELTRELARHSGVSSAPNAHDDGDASRVRVVVHDEIPDVDIDRDRIHQVLTNLLSNARKYGVSGADIEISLRLEQRATTNEIVVSVTNEEQRALSSEECSRIFDRYYRSPSSRQAKAGGLGVGLYICKKLLEAHRGRIWVECGLGSVSGGATKTIFRFALPLPS